MNILISNDDGYLAPGIQELARRIRRFGNVTVVAPEQNHSGASNSLTLNRPLSVRQVQENVFFVNGTPSDCVHIALTGLLPQKPDIVFIQKPHIIDFVFQQRDPFQAHAKRESCIFFRIDAAHFQNVGVYHAAA